MYETLAAIPIIQRVLTLAACVGGIRSHLSHLLKRPHLLPNFPLLLEILPFLLENFPLLLNSNQMSADGGRPAGVTTSCC